MRPVENISGKEFEESTIEPGIRDVVLFLRKHGFVTFASCEGGEGHPRDTAWVRVASEGNRNFISGTRIRLAQILIDGGYREFTLKEIYEHSSNEVCDVYSYVEVEFWKRKPITPEREPRGYYDV